MIVNSKAIHIFNTGNEGDIDDSGVSGPYQKINEARDNEEVKVIFYAGLVKDRQNYNGHYQFIMKTDRHIASDPNDNTEDGTVDNPEDGAAVINVPVAISPDKTSNASSQACSPSPLKIRRSALIRKYLKSPSAKTHHKEDHCKFCDFIGLTGIDLEDHLNQSLQCKKYYLRNYKQKNILPILLNMLLIANHELIVCKGIPLFQSCTLLDIVVFS